MIARDHICPLCKDHGFQTFLDKSAGRKINVLKIYCKLKSLGCQWVGELGRLEHHLDVREGNCGFVEVECDFGPVGCVMKLLRRDLPVHREEYMHKHLALMSVMSLKTADEFDRRLREQRAEFQQQLQEKDEQLRRMLQEKDEQLAAILHRKFQEHKDVTGRMLQEKDQQSKLQIVTLQKQVKSQLQKQVKQIQALQGGQQQLQKETKEQLATLQKVVQKQIDQLQEKDGQRLVETCQQFQKHEEQLTKLGEERRREAKELDGRIRSEADERKQEFIKLREEVQKMGEQTKQAVAKHARDLQEQDKEIKELREQMEEKIHDLEDRVPPFEFTMPEFSKHKANDTEWRSPPFYSDPGGYKFLIGVRANGNGLSMQGTRVSLKTYKVRTDHDDRLTWPRTILITIQLLNQRTGKWDHEAVDGVGCIRGRPSSQCESSSKICRFLVHSKLDPYLKNDSLQFRIAKVELH